MANSSYGQILRSTAFTGGASMVTLALGVLRTKILAVLLGPAGVGLAGIYTSVIGIASTLAGMGIGSSGVREIAEAARGGDVVRVARTARTLRRMALILGFAGGIGLAALSGPVSRMTFGDTDHRGNIALLGLAVFFGSVFSGQTALIQGLRRIADLARVNVLGAVVSTVVGVPLIWWLGIKGIVGMLVVVPGVNVVLSWWVFRRIPVLPEPISWKETALESRRMLQLGCAFLISALLTVGTTYFIRMWITRELGVDAAGHYSAAYTLSGIYAGFVLQAMGADFYPRLTAAANDPMAMNRLVNEQTEIALLIAVPGVLGTLALGPWVIRAFYAAGFDPAVDVLRWQALGILGRVLSWPMGFILLAQGAGRIFVVTEVVANCIHGGLTALLVSRCGLVGSGMAFAGLYACHLIMIGLIVHARTGFRWSPENRKQLIWMIPSVILGFLLSVSGKSAGSAATTGLGGVLALGASAVCAQGILRRGGGEQLKRGLDRLRIRKT